jgi:hypothetical protein
MNILVFLIPTVIGFLISLIVFIPPLRNVARSSGTFRLLLTFTLGLAAFIIIYGGQTYSLAYTSYHMGEFRYECPSCDFQTYIPPEYTPEEMEYEKAIIIEYWAREILPPPFQSACSTKNPTVCRLADAIASRKYHQADHSLTNVKIEWNTFFLNFAIGFCGTISTVFFVAIFTLWNDIQRPIPALRPDKNSRCQET